MDGAETPTQTEPQKTTSIIINDSNNSDDEGQDIGEPQNLEQNVHNATALGWAIAELLGRCFALPEEKPDEIAWDGSALVMLQETFTPREKIHALMEHIIFLADLLDVSACEIHHDNDPDNTKRYVDVLQNYIQQLTHIPPGPTADQERAQFRGKINERLFWWDLNIQIALQNRPQVVHKAYLVGRSVAALRWYFGQQNNILDNNFLEKVCHEYIPMLGAYLSPFSTEALAYSVEAWGKAISAGQVQPGPDGPEGKAPPELQKQASIWHSLATNQRSALSYLDPSVASRPFIIRVLRISWPVYIGGIILLILLLALVLFVLLSHLNLIITTVTTAGATIAALGITHTVVSSLGGILQRAFSGSTLEKVETRATTAIKVSVIDNVWNSTQQQAVNKVTLILPAGMVQQGMQALQAKG